MGITGKRLTQIASILHDKVAWGLETVDEKGQVIKDYPVDKNSRRIIVPASTINGAGGNSGSNNNDNNIGGNVDNTTENRIPDVGVDTDPGHFLINRASLWTGRTVPGQSNHITLAKQITGVNGVGDGLQISILLEKRTITNGVPGEPVDLPLKASTKDKKIDGYFVTTSPMPISIETKDIIMGKKLKIPFDGIGENLDGVKVHQVPALSITYNADGTFDFEDQQGWYLDKTGDGNNGATYNVIVTHIKNYTKGPKVELLPNGTPLWEGNITAGSNTQPNHIALSRVNKDLTNVGSGIKIYFPDPVPLSFDSSDPKGIIPFKNLKLNVPNPWIIPFSQLDDGNTLSAFANLKSNDKVIAYYKNNNNGKYDTMFLITINYLGHNLLSTNSNTLLYSKRKDENYFLTGCDNQSDYHGRSVYVTLPIIKVTSYQE